MPAPKIKICGISTPETLDAVIAARADHVGLMFYPPSPRFVSHEIARQLGQCAAGRIGRVGVFVDADDAALADAIAAGGLDALQFHGAESPERVAQARARFGLPVWKVLSVAARGDLDRAKSYTGAADFLLLDAKTPKGALPGAKVDMLQDEAVVGQLIDQQQQFVERFGKRQRIEQLRTDVTIDTADRQIRQCEIGRAHV